jgi:type IV pilus assembly protein PilE
MSLTELCVTLGVMALLSALVLPGYGDHQRRTRRLDAQTALLELQVAQSRWRASHDRHADTLSSLGWSSELSAQGHYRLAIDSSSEDGFQLSATAQGPQARDQVCNPMRLALRDSATVVLSAGTSTEGDPAACWR